MRFWISKHAGVLVASQVAEHLRLAIASGVIQAGERLPSLRALAVRLSDQPNTVRLAHEELQRDSWVELRKGCGAYARERLGVQSADTLTASFLASMRGLGLDDDGIRAALAGC